MPIITGLEVQKRDKQRVNVYLDGEFAFGLSLIEAAQLRKGQELTDRQIAQLRADDEIDRAYNHAIRFLGYRPRSTAEIEKNLRQHRYTDEAIEAVIVKLSEQKYLDDEAFARYWVANRTEFKPRGARALRAELRQKGVADAIIDAVLSEQNSYDDAYRAAQSKVRRYKHKTRAEFRQKVGQFLLRRGFEYHIIRPVLAQLIDELVADDPHFFTKHGDEEVSDEF